MIGRRSFLALALAAAPGGILAACDTPPKRQQFPTITYEHRPAFRLDVAAVEIVETTDPAIAAEDVGGEFPQAPVAALREWARDRLQAVGQAGKAVLTITEARAVNAPLPRSASLSAVDLSDQYELTLAIELRAENPAPRRAGSITARARRVQTVREDMTINQREGLLFSLLDATLRDLNAQAERLIPRYLGPLLR